MKGIREMAKEKSLNLNVFSLLDKSVLKALAAFGFSEPTLSQVKAIPLILKGENVLFIAPTLPFRS